MRSRALLDAPQQADDELSVQVASWSRLVGCMGRSPSKLSLGPPGVHVRSGRPRALLKAHGRSCAIPRTLGRSCGLLGAPEALTRDLSSKILVVFIGLCYLLLTQGSVCGRIAL